MTVLVVDDDPSVLSALALLLQQEGITVVTAESPHEALGIVLEKDVSLVLLDLNFKKDTTSGEEGLSALSTLTHNRPSLPVVVMTGWASIEGAVDAMKRGARSYLPKHSDNEAILRLVRRFDRSSWTPVDEWDEMAQMSARMRDVSRVIEQVAHSDLPVLVTGEHGTGKEMVARRIHRRSGREGPFVTANAGAIPAGMVESELFGHVRGAFTDAKTERVGAFAEAAGGTLFLDEIATMPALQQAKLLRVLQDGEFRPLGASSASWSDARLVSATNADIQRCIDDGSFRADLLYRLNAVHIQLPPLRERRDQIPALALKFANETAKRYTLAPPELGDEVLSTLSAHPWPGNVRELEHTMQRAVLLSSQTGVVTAEALQLGEATRGQEPASSTTLIDVQRRAIRDALERFPRDRRAAAASLGLSRSTFYRRIKQLGIKLE